MPPAIAHILALGMACPVGLDSRSALAAMRAGITRFTEVDDMVGPGGPVRASMLARIGFAATRTERAVAFAFHALQETVAGLGELTEQPLACFLALPEPGVGPRIETDRLLRVLAGARTDMGTPLRLELRHGGIIEAGRAGVFVAFERALALLAERKVRLALIGGVDSHTGSVPDRREKASCRHREPPPHASARLRRGESSARSQKPRASGPGYLPGGRRQSQRARAARRRLGAARGTRRRVDVAADHS